MIANMNWREKLKRLKGRAVNIANLPYVNANTLWDRYFIMRPAGLGQKQDFSLIRAGLIVRCGMAWD
jgi:hypothetical protein